MDDIAIEEWIDAPKGKKNDTWIDLIYSHYKDGKHWIEAIVRYDGCITYKQSYNQPFPNNEEEQDTFHICDIDEFIKALILLKEASIKHFGEDWNK